MCERSGARRDADPIGCLFLTTRDDRLGDFPAKPRSHGLDAKGIDAVLASQLETTPDTVVTLVNGDKHVVKEDVPTIIALTRAWHAEIFHTITTVEGDEATTSPLHLVPDGERG